jgi:hypothetical protein
MAEAGRALPAHSENPGPSKINSRAVFAPLLHPGIKLLPLRVEQEKRGVTMYQRILVPIDGSAIAEPVPGVDLFF